MRALRSIGATTLILVVGSIAMAKTDRTYYTPERLEWMRENLQQHEWAQQEHDKIIARADNWVHYEDDRLKDLVPPPWIARDGTVHASGCPIHGQELMNYPQGLKSWKMSFDNMYKIQCPVDGEWYPSNDFWAYLQGGCQDKSLLTGDYVDDGWGWDPGDGGKKYWFVAFYAGEMTRRWLLPAINDMSRAYLLTGDERYAHKTAVLLWQLAQFYPDYEYEKQSRYGLEFMSNYYGRLQYHTWECFTIQDVSVAYDAIFPALEGDMQLEQWTGKSIAEVKTDIEERILRQAAKDIMADPPIIAGNYGMHQSALLRVALVLDTEHGEPSSADMVDWVVTGPAQVKRSSATPLPDAIINLLHRDGFPQESPSYNCHYLTDLEEVADLLMLNGVDMWQVPRFQSLYLWPLDYTVVGTMSQPMGDSNNQFAGSLGTSPTYLERAFQHIGDPRLAAMMMAREKPAFRTDLFQRSMEQEIRRVAAEYGEPAGVKSSLLPGLGYATLQTGNEDNRTAIAMFYGYYTAHVHMDRLNLEIYSHNHTLIPDFGYPETADTYDPRRFGWLSHSAVHNLVMVDACGQWMGRDNGELVTYHPDGWARMVEARAPIAYDHYMKLDDYRRAVLLIDVDPSTAYVVDMFRVVGGSQHDWLVHGPPSEFVSETIPLSEPRTEGTLAGPDVPYGQFYDNPDMIEGKPGTRYYPYTGSAFQWLFNVQQSSLDDTTGTVRWDLNRDPDVFPNKPTEGIGLRAHLLGEQETIFACDGIPQRRTGFPEQHKWVIRRRAADTEELQSVFTTVFEPFGQASPYIESVASIPIEPDDGSVALSITHRGGTDIVAWTAHPEIEHRFGEYTLNGRAAIIRLGAQDQPTAARLLDGTSLRGAGVELTERATRRATIASVDYEANTVTLDQPLVRESLVGRWLMVDTGRHKDAVRVDGVVSPTTFSLGDQDLRTATGGMTSIADGQAVSTDRVTYFGFPGMTLVNGLLQPVGRLSLADTDRLEVDEANLSEASFPEVNGTRRFFVMAIGAGDAVFIPSDVEISMDDL